MDTKDLRSMLDRIRSIRHACDLDLLLFFYRHPCTLLTGEHFVDYLGYDREQVAKSLDGLIEAGLVKRSQNPSHSAQLYVLGLPGDLPSSFLKIVATRAGREEVIRLLRPGTNSVPPTEARLSTRTSDHGHT